MVKYVLFPYKQINDFKNYFQSLNKHQFQIMLRKYRKI